MKKLFLAAICLCTGFCLHAQNQKIDLPARTAERGTSTMKAFENRQSVREYADRELAMQDLADLLWAANGFNREDKRTAATAMNAQEIDIYVCTKDGACLYDAKSHTLVMVSQEDIRAHFGNQEFVKTAPACILIVADMSRERNDNETTRRMTAYDAGIVSQNIYMFCAANGLGTVCRGGMDQGKLREALKLGDNYILHLNHPVGYLK